MGVSGVAGGGGGLRPAVRAAVSRRRRSAPRHRRSDGLLRLTTFAASSALHGVLIGALLWSSTWGTLPAGPERAVLIAFLTGAPAAAPEAGDKAPGAATGAIRGAERAPVRARPASTRMYAAGARPKASARATSIALTAVPESMPAEGGAAPVEPGLLLLDPEPTPEPRLAVASTPTTVVPVEPVVSATGAPAAVVAETMRVTDLTPPKPARPASAVPVDSIPAAEAARTVTKADPPKASPVPAEKLQDERPAPASPTPAPRVVAAPPPAPTSVAPPLPPVIALAAAAPPPAAPARAVTTPAPPGDRVAHAAPTSSPPPLLSAPLPATAGLSISVERPTAGVTAESVHALSGRILGGKAAAVQLQVNGVPQILDVWGATFEGEIALKAGRNEIRLAASGSRGRVERQIELEYRPPEASSELRILRPESGPLPEPLTDVLHVEGESSAPKGKLRIVFNGFAIPASAANGRFSAVVPRIGAEMTIWAETQGENVERSNAVTVHGTTVASAAYLLLHLPTYGHEATPTVWLSHRPNPSSTENVPALTVLPPASAPGNGGYSLYTIPKPKAGAYNLVLDYRLPIGEVVEKGWAMLFIPRDTGYRVWRLGPFRLTGKGRAILGRFLLPQGLFWDEDGWYNGSTETAEVITRFRYTDHLMWLERREEFDTARR